MNCPHCSISLISEGYEGVTIDRCPTCTGTWLDAGELTHIVETREVDIPLEVVRETLALATIGVSSRDARTLVACPKCHVPMNTINYDYTSGVIINHCGAGHGNWLDATELEKVQAHHEYWDHQRKNLETDWVSFGRSVRGRRSRVADEAQGRENRPTEYVVQQVVRTFLGARAQTP